jgi:hypothetical protein
MPDPDPEENAAESPPASPDFGDGSAPCLPENLTLENIIDSTGELEHLNDLILLSLERAGGFTCPEAYFSTVQPILDLLEVEIRVRCRPGMSRNAMKLIIQDWIDSEIRELQ